MSASYYEFTLGKPARLDDFVIAANAPCFVHKWQYHSARVIGRPPLFVASKASPQLVTSCCNERRFGELDILDFPAHVHIAIVGVRLFTLK